MEKYTKVVVIPKANHTSPDALTRYEIANILSQRIQDIAHGGATTLEVEEMQVKVKGYEGNLDRSKVVADNYIKLTSTEAIAIMELNLGKCPYKIEREIKYDKKTNTKYVEIKNPNKLRREIIPI